MPPKKTRLKRSPPNRERNTSFSQNLPTIEIWKRVKCLSDDVCRVVGVVRTAQHVSGDRGVVRGVYLLEPTPSRLRNTGERRSHNCSPRHQLHVRIGRKHFKINAATREHSRTQGKTPTCLALLGPGKRTGAGADRVAAAARASPLESSP